MVSPKDNIADTFDVSAAFDDFIIEVRLSISPVEENENNGNEIITKMENHFLKTKKGLKIKPLKYLIISDFLLSATAKHFL